MVQEKNDSVNVSKVSRCRIKEISSSSGAKLVPCGLLFEEE